MRRAKKIIEFSGELKKKIDEESESIKLRTGFSKEDAESALTHATEHFIYVGNSESAAWDNAISLTASAEYLAKKHDSNLSGMVGQLLYSQIHRAHPGIRM